MLLLFFFGDPYGNLNPAELASAHRQKDFSDIWPFVAAQLVLEKSSNGFSQPYA